jgi:hypothetical protein
VYEIDESLMQITFQKNIVHGTKQNRPEAVDEIHE